jgi:iron(III) transport system permease protein
MTDSAMHAGMSPRRGFDWEHASRYLISAIMLVIALLIIVLPLYALLSQSFEDHQGNFVGIDNFVNYAKDPILRQSVINSLWVAAALRCCRSWRRRCCRPSR